MSSEILWKIPDNWRWATISEIGEVVSGGTPSSKEPKYWGDDINWISPADLTGYSKKTIRKGKKSITKEGLKNSSAKVMPAGSVHFSSRAPIGYVVISAEPLATNQGFKNLVPAEGIFNEYIYYYLKSSKQIAEKRASGTTFLELSGQAFRLLPLPLAPLNEQKRIVAKIEELFSKLDNAIAALKTAREQLKFYRQAILKHAFEGKLTSRWREENTDKLETPQQLHVRIQQERDTHYQQKLKIWKAEIKEWEEKGKKGKPPKKPKQSLSFRLLPNVELDSLPQIPSGFTYTYLANVGNLGRGKSKHRPRNDSRLFGGKYPFIQTGEVKAANRKITTFEQTYSDFGLAQSKLWPASTLCITIAANIAETAFLGFDGCFPDSVVGFTAYNSILPEYVELFIKAVRIRIEAYAPATAQKNINLTTLESLVIPYCSINEQRQIVSELESRFSIIDKNEAEIEQALQLAEILRQSILKQAFCGRLVPQDPNDEPASELLARIKAEKYQQKQSAQKSANKHSLKKISQEV